MIAAPAHAAPAPAVPPSAHVAPAHVAAAPANGALPLAHGAAAHATPPPSFQVACARLVGGRVAAVVAAEAATGRLRALVHPDLAARPTPPGSAFKLVTGLAALAAGDPGAPPCRGWLRAPGAGGRPEVLRCWRPEGHGTLGLEGAIAASCNLHFVGLGRRVGAAGLAAAAGRCGLAAPAGAHVDARDVRIAIGEGDGWAMTPLQAAGLAAAIATGGPRRAIAWTPEAAAGDALGPPAHLARLRAGMRLAVVKGSARKAATRGLAVAGKTGTGTYRDGSNRTHGWFVGFAEAPRRPTLALAVLVDDASGFGEAATLAGQVLAAWRDTP